VKNVPDPQASPVTRRAALDAHGMERLRVGRVLEGAEREAVIAEHIAWLERRNDSLRDVDTSVSPLAKFIDERVNSKWKR
jgi:hypothetical protein